MGRLEPLTVQALGRSPYDDVVPGEGPADPRGHQQLYDDRGRPINPETKRINRDIVRSHNEVMTVIGVAEPENGTAEAQAETARKHHEFEDRVGKRLSLVGGVLETAAIWGVNGMRQRILLYKPYSQVTFYGMFQLVRSEQSPASYFFDGLPSFLASTVIEQLVVPGSKKSPLVQYLTLYVRLHLAIYTFFQRTGIIPLRSMLPNWRFFIPGTSVSPIPLPTAPTSLRPRSLLQWMGALALGAAPFAGFYLYTKMYILTTRTLRFTIYQLLPRPYNANRRRLFRETGSSSLGADAPVELGTDEPMQMLAPFPPPPANEPTATPGAALRRQSTVSLRGSNSGPAGAPTGSDEFASDDEEAEIMGATLISFDVEATEATPENGISPLADDAQGLDAGNANPAANTNHNHTPPTVWSAELRPNIIDSNRPGAGPGTAGPHDLVYRENALMRLPAVMAADVLAVTPARLLMTPVAAAVWLRLARPYMARLGRPLEGVLSAPGAWWGACTARGLANLLGLELLLVAVHFGAWTAVMSLAQTFRLSEEEWNERVGDVAADGGEI